MLNLFAGVGGCVLGLQRAGIEPAAFCDVDPECRAVLAKNWPGVRCFDDVRTLKGSDVGPVDIITGGFPCQDISTARTGSGLPLGDGLDGARSGLWFEQLRLVDELRPDYVVGENVAALCGRGLDRILTSLAAIRYDAEWHCIPAAYLGAPQRRDRIWIVAYPSGKGLAGPVLDGDAVSFAARTQLAQFGDLVVPVGGAWSDNIPDIRMGDGLSVEPHQLKQLGNSSVPPISQAIGEAIVRRELELCNL